MEQINLNIIPDGVMPVCHASQFDKNRTIRFNLKDNGSVYTLAGTETITCTVRKPDDTENTINVANTSSSYVDVTFGLGDTDLSGYAMCELKIVKGTQTIGSRNFLLNIEADAFDGSKFEERSASGAIASFETNYIDNLNELVVNITATQAGSGTPSPSNPRAISGWSSCDITRCGKNMLDADALFHNQATWKRGALKLNPNTKYTVSSNCDNSKVLVFFNYQEAYTTATAVYNGHPTTFTTDSSGMAYYQERVVSGDYNDYWYQLETGDTATTYEPYNGTTYPISLGDTYYGGTLNVTTGELTINRGIIALDDNDISWNYTSGNAFFYSNIPFSIASNKYICEKYNNVGLKSDAQMASIDNYSMGYSSSAGKLQIKVKDTNYTNASLFKSSLNGCKLVYELATPTTVQLTPTEVRTLLNCNIFADTGNIVSCKYLVEVT